MALFLTPFPAHSLPFTFGHGFLDMVWHLKLRQTLKEEKKLIEKHFKDNKEVCYIIFHKKPCLTLLDAHLVPSWTIPRPTKSDFFKDATLQYQKNNTLITVFINSRV